MEIIETRRENSVRLDISGRLDANTSEVLDKEVKKWLPIVAVKELVLDLKKVEYISSAAIRVLLWVQKNKREEQEFIILNPSEFCAQVFQVTGADIFLSIKHES